MKRSILVAVALAAVLAPFVASRAGAQLPVTAVGRVVDAQGNPIPDVQILLDYKGTIPQKYRMKTDKKGMFTHVNVYAGLYRVTLKKEGVGETSFDYNVQELDRLAKPPDFRFAPSAAAAPAGSGLAPAAGTPGVNATKLAADINAAIALAHDGKNDAAIASYEAILTTAPGVPLVHYNLGAAYKAKGDSAKAEASMRKAIELDPGFVDGYVGLATLLAEAGKQDEAIEAIRGGATANPKSGRLQYALGVLAESKGDSATAREAFLKAEELDPVNVETQYHLATVALNMNDKAEAIARLEKFVATAPEGTPGVEVARSLLTALKK
jgi:tetratricopeptide (TPR) repeat protein